MCARLSETNLMRARSFARRAASWGEALSIGFLAGLLMAGLALPPVAVVCDPLSRAGLQQTPWLSAGRVSDLPNDDQPHRVTVKLARRDAWTTCSPQAIGDVFLRRPSGSGQIVAIKTVCPANGCEVNFDPAAREFREACWDSSFDLAGHVIGGPAECDLQQLDVELRGERIWLREKKHARRSPADFDYRPQP
jgi:Rieske Fe-S protein